MSINGVLLEVFTSNKWTDKIPFDAHAGVITQGMTRIFDEWSLESHTFGKKDTGYTNVLNFKSDNPKLAGDIII